MREAALAFLNALDGYTLRHIAGAARPPCPQPGARWFRREDGVRQVHLKRAYDVAAVEDGIRVLVDRLWPRGLKRDEAAIDHWLKGVAPSTELRRWFGHEPSRWPEFEQRYRAELATRPPPDLTILRGLLEGRGRLTLLFAAADTERNNAVVLRDVLLRDGGETSRVAGGWPACFEATSGARQTGRWCGRGPRPPPRRGNRRGGRS